MYKILVLGVCFVFYLVQCMGIAGLIYGLYNLNWMFAGCALVLEFLGHSGVALCKSHLRRLYIHENV